MPSILMNLTIGPKKSPSRRSRNDGVGLCNSEAVTILRADPWERGRPATYSASSHPLVKTSRPLGRPRHDSPTVGRNKGDPAAIR